MADYNWSTGGGIYQAPDYSRATPGSMAVQIDQPRPTMAQPGTSPDASPGTRSSIWSDPNLLAIMLGEMGAAIMGEHQDTWQARMGKSASGLGRSFKMADIAARREQERKADRDYWRRAFESISGHQGPQETDTMSLGGIRTERPY